MLLVPADHCVNQWREGARQSCRSLASRGLRLSTVKFPVKNNHNHMCMEGPKEEYVLPSPISVSLNDSVKQQHPASVSGSLSPPSANLCLAFKHPSQFYYINRTEECSQRCAADVLFSRENKDFAETWLLIWSVTCLVVTTSTVLSFKTRSLPFRCPERIVFMYSLGYMIRLIFGREEVSCHLDSQHNVSLLITEGPDNFKCTVVFVLL